MNYEINILENDEFDALPYKHSKTALGMSDAATGKAYVRRTGVEALDAGTIRHEFDELLQKVSPHEEDGIRYKSGGALGKILAPVLGIALAPFTGGLSALAAFGTSALAGGALAAGTGAFSRAKKPEKYGSNSFGSVFKDAAIGGLSAGGANLAATGFGSAFSGASKGGAGFFGSVGQGLKGAVGLPTSTGPSAFGSGSGALTGGPNTAGGLGGQFSQAANAGSGGGAALASTAGNFAAPAALGATKALSNIGGKAAGALALRSSARSLTQKLGAFAATTSKGIARNAASNALVGGLTPPSATAITGAGGGALGNFGNFQGGNNNVFNAFGGDQNLQNSIGSSGEFQNPFTQAKFDEGKAAINTQSDVEGNSILDRFGFSGNRDVSGSSALQNQLAQVQQSRQSNIQQFGQGGDDVNAQAFSQFRYDGVKNANGLSDSKMTEFINLAKQPDDVIKSQFPGMAPSAFREIFEGIA